MVANRLSTGEVITVPASLAVGPFTYRASLKFDSLGRLVIAG
jgi:hypothetical protein